MTRDGWLALCLLLPVGAALLQARGWDTRASLFPTIIATPVLLLLLLQIAFSVRSARQSAVRVHGLPTARDDATDPDERRRIISIVAWLAAFALLVWLLGFPVGGTLGTFVYLVRTARESWRIVLGVTLGTALFFYAATQWLAVPFPPGVIQDLFRAGT